MISKCKSSEVLLWCAKTAVPRVARQVTHVCTSAQAAPRRWGPLYSTPYPSSISKPMGGPNSFSLAKIARPTYSVLHATSATTNPTGVRMSSKCNRREVLCWCAKTVEARIARHGARICTSAQPAPGKWGLLCSTPRLSNISETMAGARSLAKIARRPVQKGRHAYVCNFAGASESASAFAPSIKTAARSHLAYMEKGAGQEATVIYPRTIEISWMH